MMAALGAGGYTAGLFHLWTHAFFKALLFLGAGSVIHAVHSNNMSRHGRAQEGDAGDLLDLGRRRRCRWRGSCPFAGFFSKDEILAPSATRGTDAVMWIGIAGGLRHRLLHDPGDGPHLPSASTRAMAILTSPPAS